MNQSVMFIAGII